MQSNPVTADEYLLGDLGEEGEKGKLTTRTMKKCWR